MTNRPSHDQQPHLNHPGGHADQQNGPSRDPASGGTPEAPGPWASRFEREVDQKLFARQASNEFERLFYTHRGRRIHKWHHYLEIYDRHFSWLLAGRRARSEIQPVRLLEIGVAGGGSLQMWRKYLGPEAIIFGVDIDRTCRDVADPDVQVRIGNQADKAFLRSVIDEIGGIDVVVDDGSHVGSHQIASFDVLFPRLSENGLYICEDLHTAYRPNYEGGLNRDGTFIEFTKQMIDWLHDWYVKEGDRKRGHNDVYGFATGVFGLSVYDSVVVIEKRPKDKPFHTTVGEVEGPQASCVPPAR
jgi:hypothetical protein